MTVGAVLVALVAIAGGAIMLWKRLNTEHRQSIDIDAVIDAKYPNRAEPAPTGVPASSSGPLEPDESFWNPSLRPEVVGFLADEVLVEHDVVEPGPDDVHEAPVEVAPPVAADRFPAPVRSVGPDVPLPGEPDEVELPRPWIATPAVPARDFGAPEGDPFEQLKRRRDRIAVQVADTFRELHQLRTEALRRASQAEHNASLATHARARAGRMVRDGRRVSAEGRVRPAEMPSADDAFGDVHHFRTEALKRAQQAESGAQQVSNARERATRLLAEQRELEAQMVRLQRLGSQGAPGAQGQRNPVRSG